jgi:hypothetical protein
MYVLEEYLAVIVLAVVVSFAGSLAVVLLLTPNEEARFFGKALSTGSFAMPPSWPRLWPLMKIVETSQRLSVGSSQKVKRVLGQLHIGPRANSQWKTFSGRIVKEIFTRTDAAKDRTGRLMP